MRHRLIYLSIGAAMLFILGVIFKEPIQARFTPYAEVVYALLILIGVGVPFATITLFRVKENPHLLDQLFDLQIAKRKEKKRYTAKHYLGRQKNLTLPKKVREKKHAYLSQLHRKQNNGKQAGESKKRKRDNANDYAYPPEAQKDIVEKYWEARKRGEVENRDAWASRYNISGRTLRTYEKAYLTEINGNKT